ncbi:hypothetical protein AbraIFM66951_000345 [Aspergillus brasiliensis]|uniref:Uncharacterized protein n=1 Tax=Aspergillus brasiliensis TaxID=319629 RepID=A0A9W6DKL4_9EURO|nr:hypothetical protein AbraCBS73388_000331 [Aspergillus brasiliensis]GKZ42024.1 hypothetical protein AbraIFM66951_000345 [Aspergillus brasiliensis]
MSNYNSSNMRIELTSPEGSQHPVRPPVVEPQLTIAAEYNMVRYGVAYGISSHFDETYGTLYTLQVYDRNGVPNLRVQRILGFGAVERQLNHYLENYPVRSPDVENDL